MTSRLYSQLAVRVSKRSFALWWISFLLLHGIASVVFGQNALFYWHLDGTYFYYCLQFYGIGMEVRSYSAFAVLLAVVALVHALAVGKMIAASLYHRSLSFTLGSAMECPVWPIKLYHFLWDREGILGVEGEYFHAIMFVRELAETSLRTHQAYRMSAFLQGVWLNRFYVTLIVLNCWITPVIHHLYKKDEAKKRLICLVCDCALDVVSAVVIPLTVLASYYTSYTAADGTLEILGTDDGALYVQAVNELQLVFVVSWRDMGSRLVFLLGLIIAMSDIKELMPGVYLSNQVNQPTAIVPVTAANLNATTRPPSEALRAVRVGPVSNKVLPKPQQHVPVSTKGSSGSDKRNHMLTTLIHGLVVVWGVVILGLHVYAESHRDLPQCLFQTRPWGKTKHVCPLVLLNCYSAGISGGESEVDALWNLLDKEVLVQLQIQHCETLEMPPVLQTFSHLRSLKIYNSSIVAWTDDAAITTSHHPNLALLSFVRVNMTDDALPPGLLSADFPVTVTEIDFIVTNLRSLPSDLDTKWTRLDTLYFESGALSAVPEAVVRMKPRHLSFYGNPIRELPRELLEANTIFSLNVGATLVTSLPANVTWGSDSDSIWYLHVSHTQISYFPAWIDKMVALALAQYRLLIIAGDTPYCSQLEEIQAGTASEFAVPQSDQLPPLSVLMDASPGNINTLQQLVSCDADNGPSFYLLAHEDDKNRLVV